MVAIIKTGHSVQRILNYNENKVKDGVAACIGAENYPVDHDRLSFNMKLNLLLRQLQLNENVTRNSVHISLNFDPSESNLDPQKLMQIAIKYMQKIGFGEQPYLVYQHFDAGHPHIHLVSIKVKPDGKRIDMQNIGKNQSEQARKEIEKEFSLVVAEGRKNKEIYRLQPVTIGKIHYGKLQSKKAISNVLGQVLDSYKFTSLPELNAILRQYNVLADRGSEESRTFIAGGLVYRILGEDGKPVGVPIKASDFYNTPTLNFLSKKFDENESRRQPYKARIRNTIDLLLGDKKMSLDELAASLQKKGIYMSLRQSETGQIYGITYVDHETRCVFNGSVLGKAYSAKAMQERCITKPGHKPDVTTHPTDVHTGLQPWSVTSAAENKAVQYVPQESEGTAASPNLLQTLLEPEKAHEYVPGQFKKGKKRKKRRNNLNNNQ